jgi:hypothetical protein
VNVSAIIVTRGDVDMHPILESLPDEWEVLVWDNGAGSLRRWCRPDPDWIWQHDMSVASAEITDVSVYGRYAAIEYASHDLIYVQDDDVIVSDPQAIVATWQSVYNSRSLGVAPPPGDPLDFLVANMPQEFRHDGYTDSCLVGFGACFHRDAPGKAFEKYNASGRWDQPREMYLRTCDVVFTTLTPRVLVDVPKQDMAYATNSTRMYRQPGHLDERTRMLHLARQVRDS